MLINSLREWASLAIQLLLAVFLMGVMDAVVKPLYEPEYMEITMDSASRAFIVSLPVIPASSQLPGFPQLLFWTTAACFLTRWGLRKLQRPSDPKSWWAGRLRTSVPYAPEEHIIASLLRLEGTSIQMVLFKPLFWILLLVHIILRHVNDKFTPLPSLDATVLVGLPSSLLIFLVVFYGDRCYQRYYELWGHVSALNAMVYNWVLQTGFIYSPLEMGQAQLDKIAPRLTGIMSDPSVAVVNDIKGTGVATEKQRLERYRKIRLAAMWRASRRMLAAFHLLLRTVDPDDVDTNFIGQAKWAACRKASPFKGHGLEEIDYEQLEALGMMRKPEIDAIRYYGENKAALQFIVPIKWALDDLQLDCRPANRMETQSRNYEAMQSIAAGFQERALLMVNLLQQPTPLAYYHILKVMQVVVGLIISYAFVDIFEGEWWVSVITYSVIMLMLLGMQEIAVSMSNPFGDDPTDFDTRTLCQDAYTNAVAYLSMSARYEIPKQFSLLGNEEGIDNPLVRDKAYRVGKHFSELDNVSPGGQSAVSHDGYERIEA